MPRRLISYISGVLVFVSAAVSLHSCGGDREEERTLVVFHAGSLSVPFREISERFMDENPGVTVQLEAAGSRTCARKISDLGRECDVMASADYTVIDALLIPDHASWNIRFASNEMTIVYTERSSRAGEITAESWPAISWKKYIDIIKDI